MFPIIDCHCHIYPSKIADKAVLGIGSFYNIGMCYDGRLETLKEENKQNGITHSLIFSVATKPTQTQSINQFIADNVQQSPESFTGLGTLHPDSQDIKGDIDHLIELGLKGVKLHPDIQGVAIDDKRCFKIYELCENRLPILFHTGDKRYNFSNPTQLKKVLDTFPNLTVIGAHFGGYSVWDKVKDTLVEYKNLYVDCSSSLAFMKPKEAEELVEFFGDKRVLFGTDFPMWKINEELLRFDKLGLNNAQKQRIFYQNACELFDIREDEILKKYKKDRENT